MKKRGKALIDVLRSSDDPFKTTSPVHAIAQTLVLIRVLNVV